MIDAAALEFWRRFRGPFWGSIMISFVVLNWRAFLYLSYPEGAWKVRDRIAWLQQYVYEDERWNWWYLVVGPLLFGLFAFSILPYIISWFGGFRHRAMVLDKNRRERIDQLHTKQQLEISRLAGEIQALQKSVSDLQQANGALHHQLSEAESRATAAKNAQLSVLRSFIKVEQKLKNGLISVSQGNSPAHPKQVIPVLQAAGLVDNVGKITDDGNALRMTL